MRSLLITGTCMFMFLSASAQVDNTQVKIPEGFVSLFDGKDLEGWKIPDGDNGHWKVFNGVIKQKIGRSHV